MFKALVDQKTSKGARKKGDEMPEMLDASPKAVKFAVDNGLMVWSGKGGEYGPVDVGGVKSAPAKAKAKAPVSRDEFEILSARVAEIWALLQSEGSAPGPKASPSPPKTGR